MGTLNNRCRIIIGTEKGTIILTTTHRDPFPHSLLRTRQLVELAASRRGCPNGPSTPYYRTLGPFWVPKTMKKDYLDP